MAFPVFAVMAIAAGLSAIGGSVASGASAKRADEARAAEYESQFKSDKAAAELQLEQSGRAGERAMEIGKKQLGLEEERLREQSIGTRFQQEKMEADVQREHAGLLAGQSAEQFQEEKRRSGIKKSLWG